MNGGDSNLGGPQAMPSSSSPATPGPQPAVSDDSASKDSSPILAVPHADRPAPVSSPLATPSHPTPQVTPPQPSPQPVADAPTPVEDTFSSLSSPAPASPAPQPSVAPAPQAPLVTPQPAAPVSPTVPSSPAPANPVMPAGTPIMPTQSAPASQPYIYPGTMVTPQMPASDDIVLPSSTPASKSRKPLIIAIICVALVAVVALIAWAVSSLSSTTTTSTTQTIEKYTTKSEVYDALWDFNTFHYSHLIESYGNTIGLAPDFKMSDTNILFPAESYAGILSEKVNNATAAYNDLLPKLPDQISSDGIDLSQTKALIGESLDSMQQNSALISEFYNAYIALLLSDSRPSTCIKTSAMSALEQGPTASAADEYYTVYCTALNYLNTISGTPTESEMLSLQQLVAIPASEAASTLNSLLVDVPSATGAINRLFEELTR